MMRRGTGFFVAALAVVAVPTSIYARDFLAQDACLDRGGAWFGAIGCVIDMPQIDQIVIDKSDRSLSAYSKGRLVRQMPVALGRQPVGPKQREGDDRTPEGTYPITEHKKDSGFYLALRLGYPTTEQVAQAKSSGINPGSDIMIHGIRNGFGWLGTLQRKVDWTRGCIALTDGEIEWLFRSTSEGVPVEICA
jgi:murein L,D-transpeptidase YafK